MGTERVLQEKSVPAVAVHSGPGGKQWNDNRLQAVLQAKMVETIQCRTEEEEPLIQGKFALQRKALAELQKEQKKKVPDQTKIAQLKKENSTGIPDEVKQRMEHSFAADFSSVRVHPDSSVAPRMKALAYTQGTDIHFAPGQFKPETIAGQQLLGHELTHVIQQREGRVRPTTEIGGMAVNDDAALEREADIKGARAAQR